jgi:hypothetical protein
LAGEPKAVLAAWVADAKEKGSPSFKIKHFKYDWGSNAISKKPFSKSEVRIGRSCTIL